MSAEKTASLHSHASEQTLADAPAASHSDKMPQAHSEPEKAASVTPVSSIVQFDGPQDPLNPQNWTFRKKCIQTAILAQSCVVVTFASSVFASGTEAVAAEFNVSNEVAVLGTSLYLVGYVVGPPIWGPASEFLGRRNPMMLSYSLFALFNIMAATGENIATILIGRFLTGLFGAGPISIVAGCFTDMWSSTQRGMALVLFALSVVAGPAVGPVIGNFVVDSYLGWRWTSYLTMIWAFALFAVMVLFLEESFVPVLLQTKARNLRFETGNWSLHSQHDEKRFHLKDIFRTYLGRPFAMLATEPILLITTIYVAFVYGLIFGLFEAVPYVFYNLRGWGLGPSGLVFLSLLLGAAVASGVCAAFVSRYNRILAERKAISVPEERCLPMAIGGVIFPIGLFMFAWTSPEQTSSGWGEIVAIGLVGCGFVLIFMSALNLIIDCYLMLANSAMAANALVRSAIAAAFPLFAQQMFANMGVSWAASTLGFIALALMPFPLVFRAFSRTLLEKSKYAPKIPRGPPKKAEP